jgi:hypothetical protein
MLALGAAALLGGWRAFLRFGPGNVGDGKAAMFQFQAKALIHHRLDFPKPGVEMFLPAPVSMSSADVQLRLMNWWDGKNWLPAALALGSPVKSGLHLHSGELELTGVASVGPLETQNELGLCKVRARVRWNAPEELREILRVKEIVGLRLPKGLQPGQSGDLLCSFAQDGWRWRLVSAESPWGGSWNIPLRNRTWLDLVF